MEQLTIKIPQSWAEITLGQYQEFYEMLKTPTETRPHKKIISLLSILTDVDEAYFYMMPMDTIHDINLSVDFMNDEPKGDFRNIINVNGREYGFNKDMHQLTLGEWIDLEHYITNGVIENLHYICAILYRPIVDKGDEYFDYTIKPYTEINLEGAAKLMKHKANIDDIYGIAGFFLTIANELLEPMICYSPEITEMEMKTRLDKMINRIKDAGQKKKLIELRESKDIESGIGNYLSITFPKDKSGDMNKS